MLVLEKVEVPCVLIFGCEHSNTAEVVASEDNEDGDIDSLSQSQKPP